MGVSADAAPAPSYYGQLPAATQQMQLVALDLKGSGAQDDDHEAILEIALVPIVNWQPDLAGKYSTLINPERSISPQPWIGAGRMDLELRSAPVLADVQPQLSRRINGRYLVGHNIGAAWRLLHRRCPEVIPAGLIDIRLLVQFADPDGKCDLGPVVERLGLGLTLARMAVGSAPRRALWDSVAVGLMLPALTRSAYGREVSVGQLLKAAGVPFASLRPAREDQPHSLHFFE